MVDGELRVRGPEVCVGYLDAPTRTPTPSTPRAGSAPATSRPSTPPNPILAGWLTIVGRLKDVIIRGGENISTAEVEHELEAHPDVRQAVVVGAPDPLMGERVAAFVVGAPTFDVAAARVVRSPWDRALQDAGARDRGRCTPDAADRQAGP